MSSREFTEWAAFYGMEPFGDLRGDLQAGVVAATVAEVNRDRKRRREPFTPADFLLRFGEKEEKKQPPPDASELFQQFRAWAIGAGAKVKSKDGDPE